MFLYKDMPECEGIPSCAECPHLQPHTLNTTKCMYTGSIFTKGSEDVFAACDVIDYPLRKCETCQYGEVYYNVLEDCGQIKHGEYRICCKKTDYNTKFFDCKDGCELYEKRIPLDKTIEFNFGF